MASSKIEWDDKSKARAVVLSVSAWQNLQRRAVQRDQWPAVVCEDAIKAYFSTETLPAPRSFEGPRERHNLRIRNSIWQRVANQAIQERRSRSDLLEQILREELPADLLPQA